MRVLRLYPPVKPVGLDLSKEKVVVIPHQCLSLQDIINRFMRKESLPIEKEGVYAENLGDLEKIARQDVTIRRERAAEIRVKLDAIKRAEKLRAEKEKEDKLEKPSVPPTPPSPVPPADPVAPPVR